MFYYQSEVVELVVGFHFVNEKQEWRITLAGGRGTLDDAAGRLFVDQIVTFMTDQGTQTISTYYKWCRAR